MNTKLGLRDIPAAQIIISGRNDRKHFDPLDLEALAANIQKSGLAFRPIVRPIGKNRFELVAGERRTRAIRDILKWETIPVDVRALSDEEAANLMLVENTGRVDLNPIEEALGYQSRMTQFGFSAATIASVASVKLSRVTSRLTLLNLAADIQHLVKFGNLPLGHAQSITGLDANRQRIAVKVYNQSSSMSLVQFKGIVEQLVSDQAAESQMGMFALEMQIMSAVVTSPSSGKKAKTGVPVNRNLPPVPLKTSDHTGEIMGRYLVALQDGGHSEAAAAIGNLLNTLVRFNYAQTPTLPTSMKTGQQTVEELSHHILL